MTDRASEVGYSGIHDATTGPDHLVGVGDPHITPFYTNEVTLAETEVGFDHRVWNGNAVTWM